MPIKMGNRKRSPLDVEYTLGGNFYVKKLLYIRNYKSEALIFNFTIIY